MGSLSVSTYRGLVLWQGLLLVASLLTIWCLPTNAKFAIVSTNVAEGKDVRLSLRNKPQSVIGYRWFRGEKERFDDLIIGLVYGAIAPEKGWRFYENRMIIGMDGTLLIKRAALRDTGPYTVVAYLSNGLKEIGSGRLDVYEPVIRPPILLVSKSTVSKNDTVTLSCLLHALSIDWLFNGMALQLSKRMKLSEDRRILTIDAVCMEDAGFYQCKVHDPFRSFLSWAAVLYVHHE